MKRLWIVLSLLLYATQVQAAIAFDNKASCGSGSTTVTCSSFVVSAAGNPGIWIGVTVDSGDNSTGCKWDPSGANVSFNLIKKQATASGVAVKYGYWLAGQSGTKNITCTASSGTVYADVESVTGVDQSNTADASGSLAASPIDTLNIPITVVAANCWIFAAGENDSAASLNWSGSASSRQLNSAYAGIGIADSNGIVSAGSNTVTLTATANNLYGVVASFAPAGGGGGTPGCKNGLLLLGAGCH